MPEAVFHHDNSIVNNDAEDEDQTEQRIAVEGLPRLVHEYECRHESDRNTYCRHQGIP